MYLSRGNSLGAIWLLDKRLCFCQHKINSLTASPYGTRLARDLYGDDAVVKPAMTYVFIDSVEFMPLCESGR